MRFNDYKNSYDELFPQIPKTKPVTVIESPVGNVVEEEHDEHETETPVIIEEKEIENNGSSGIGESNNE